jgi:hypothetical protein
MVDEQPPVEEVEEEERRRYPGWIPTADGGGVRAECVEAVFLSGEEVVLRAKSGNEYVADVEDIDEALREAARGEGGGPPVKPPGKRER